MEVMKGLIGAAFGISIGFIYLYLRNKYLSYRVNKLENETLYNQRRLAIEKEKIDVIQKIKNNGIDDTIERMLNGKQ